MKKKKRRCYIFQSVLHVTIFIWNSNFQLKNNKCTKLTVNEAFFFLIANVISIKDLLKYIRTNAELKTNLFISSLIPNLMQNMLRDFMPLPNVCLTLMVWHLVACFKPWLLIHYIIIHRRVLAIKNIQSI